MLALYYPHDASYAYPNFCQVSVTPPVSTNCNKANLVYITKIKKIRLYLPRKISNFPNKNVQFDLKRKKTFEVLGTYPAHMSTNINPHTAKKPYFCLAIN